MAAIHPLPRNHGYIAIRVAATIVFVLVCIALLSTYHRWPGPGKAPPPAVLSPVEQLINQYQIVSKNGDWWQASSSASVIANLYASANDSENYRKWHAIAEADLARAKQAMAP